MDMTPPSRSESFRTGFIFGCGFSVPFIILLIGGLLLVGVIAERKKEPESKLFVRKSFGPDAHLTVIDHGAQRGASSLYVFGRVSNHGADTWDHAVLQVRLLGADGKLLGVCRGGTLGPLRPGTEAYFQVDCDGWDSDAFPNYERYEVDVIDASPDF
jgi:hypothetical protein